MKLKLIIASIFLLFIGCAALKNDFGEKLIQSINEGDSLAIFELMGHHESITETSIQQFLYLVNSKFGKLIYTGNIGKDRGLYISHSIGYDYPGFIKKYEYELESDILRECVLILEFPLFSKKLSKIIIEGKKKT